MIPQPSNAEPPTSNQASSRPRTRQTSTLSTASRFRNMENKMEKSLLNFAVVSRSRPFHRVLALTMARSIVKSGLATSRRSTFAIPLANAFRSSTNFCHSSSPSTASHFLRSQSPLPSSLSIAIPSTKQYASSVLRFDSCC